MPAFPPVRPPAQEPGAAQRHVADSIATIRYEFSFKLIADFEQLLNVATEGSAAKILVTPSTSGSSTSVSHARTGRFEQGHEDKDACSRPAPQRGAREHRRFGPGPSR